MTDSTGTGGAGDVAGLGSAFGGGFPLMIAGAGLQYAGAMDKSTSIRLAMRRYLDNLKAFGERRTQRYNNLNSDINATRGQFAGNIAGLAKGVTDQAPINQGEAVSAGQQNDAVAATRAATAAMGSDYAQSGNAANADLGRASAAHGEQRLGEQVGQAALGAGLEQGDQAASTAQSQYSLADNSLRQRIAQLFQNVDVGEAADSLGQAQNESRGASNMRFAQGVGNNSMQLGQFAQLGGAGYNGLSAEARQRNMTLAQLLRQMMVGSKAPQMETI